MWWSTTVCIQGTTVTLQSTPKEPPQQRVFLEHSIAVNISVIHVYIINNANEQIISETVSSLTLCLSLIWTIFSPKFIEPILLEGERPIAVVLMSH